MTRYLARLLLAFALVVPCGAQTDLAQLELPPVERQPWVFDEFPILAWWAPPGTATLEDFERYRDAGFTICTINPDEGYDRAVEMARQAGLKMMIYRDKQGFALGKINTNRIDWHEDDPAVVGWITNDEPGSVEQVTASIKAVNELMRQNPSKYALFNLLPPPAQPAPGTEAILDAAVKNGMPILSYDQYSIYENGRDSHDAHYNSLELFRRASLKHDRPFWAFALSIKHFNYRRASESDVRWNQYASLAYGAKGLWYFTYWAPNGWEGWDNKAIVTHEGEPTELYEYVKTLNNKVLEMGDVLLELTNVDTVHTHPPTGRRGFPMNTYWIAEIEARNAIVGFFQDAEGTDYALVVNALHGKDQSARDAADIINIRVAPGVRGVEAVNWLDGQEGPLVLVRRNATLPVMGGTGVLLRAVRNGE